MEGFLDGTCGAVFIGHIGCIGNKYLIYNKIDNSELL